LLKVLPSITILSPNAEEALSLLSLDKQPPTKWRIEQAAETFLEFGIGIDGTGCIVIRCGEMGAYVKSRAREGMWIDAFWNSREDSKKIVDVTGAGNGFLGGLAAGLWLSQGDLYEAAFYATVSASFMIEQIGLPTMSSLDVQGSALWNGDLPERRLQALRVHHGR
jgi:sugar/nucleoside kinase (ribokinase family)